MFVSGQNVAKQGAFLCALPCGQPTSASSPSDSQLDTMWPKPQIPINHILSLFGVAQGQGHLPGRTFFMHYLPADMHKDQNFFGA
jgi:hypothetical protein